MHFMECSLDNEGKPSFKLSELVIVMYKDEKLQAKVEKAQKPVEASQSGVKRVKSLSSLAGKSN